MGRRAAPVSPAICEHDASDDDDGAWSDPGGGRQTLKECQVCLAPILRRKDLCVDGGFATHVTCKKSKRYLDDQARKSGAMKAMRTYQAKHPKDFGYRVRDFAVHQQGNKRGALVRTQCEQFLVECSEFEKTSTVRPVLFLSQPSHKAWYMREMLYTEAQADKQWADDVADRAVRRRVEDEILKIAVAGHTQEIRETGKIVKVSSGVAVSQESSRKRALFAALDKDLRKSRRQNESTDDDSGASGSRYRSSRRKRSRRGRSRRSSSSSPCSRMKGVRHHASRSRSPSRSHRKLGSGMGSRPSTAGRTPLPARSPSVASQAEALDSTPRSEVKSKKRTAGCETRVSSREVEAELESAQKVDAEDLIDQKMHLDDSVSADMEKLTKAVEALEKNIEKVSEDKDDKQKVDQLDIDDWISKAQRMKEELTELLKSARNAKIAGFPPARDLALKKQTEVVQLLATLASNTKACKKLLLARSDKDKKAKGKVHYDEGKKAKHFLSLGCGRRRAHMGSVLMFYGNKEVGERPENWVKEVPAKDFNESKVMLFGPNDSPIQDMLTALSAEVNAAEDRMAVMLNKKANAAHRGLQVQVDFDKGSLPTSWKTPLDAFVPEDIGDVFRPWSVVVRRHTLRIGLASWPLVGFGSFIAATNAPVLVAAVDMNQVLEASEIDLLDQFDDALAGKRLKDVSWPMMVLAKGGTCWIPYGTLALVATYEEVGSFTVFPWANKAMLVAAKKRGEACEFLTDALVKYLKKNEDKTGLKKLCPAVVDLVSACKD
jgi:hypothetical protein